MHAEDDWVDRMKSIRTEVLDQIVDHEKRNAVSWRQHINKKLNELKKDYIITYSNLHTRARLGVNDDKRKAVLLKDIRLEKLKKLATINLMPSTQLSGYQNRLASLASCFQLTDQDLERVPICPHCNFRPSSDTKISLNTTSYVSSHLGSFNASFLLEQLDDQLDNMVSEWSSNLLSNLEDPTTQENLKLIKPDAKKLVESFLKKRELPDKLSDDFIQALQDVLSGLTKIEINSTKIREALLAGGSPATIDDLKIRFDNFLTDLSKGKEPGKVRIVLE